MPQLASPPTEAAGELTVAAQHPWEGLGIIDTMINIPDPSDVADAVPGLMPGDLGAKLKGLSKTELFAGSPTIPAGRDVVDYILGEMDRFSIATGLINLGPAGGAAERALRAHPARFAATYTVDPHLGMDGVRALDHAVRLRGARAAYAKPAMLWPSVPINNPAFYPLYAKCVELDIPIFILAGVPGPRVPFGPQNVELIDEICWIFPDLKLVMRHGAEPWEDLAVKLMLKWPNLYYSTSAFSPKYYPKAIVNYANTRGEDKVLYAGYFPTGLSLERIFSELPAVPLRDQVWPKFLRHNAARLLKLESRP